ncbi:MAG: hypothetical protein F6K42_01210 [Leptolyngbya sp. SIO1D8]|nr:hypothetical protein [Leptolyngbya sp. SIO1D8]
MFYLHHPVRHLLAAAAFSCLSINLLPIGTTLLASNSNSEDAAQHRGSGRLTTQELLSENQVAYRGTGRYRQRQEQPELAHRGSGRVDDDTADSTKVSYRGSGRILPNTEFSKIA